MKKITVFLLVFAMMLSAAACGKNMNTADTEDSAVVSGELTGNSTSDVAESETDEEKETITDGTSTGNEDADTEHTEEEGSDANGNDKNVNNGSTGSAEKAANYASGETTEAQTRETYPRAELDDEDRVYIAEISFPVKARLTLDCTYYVVDTEIIDDSNGIAKANDVYAMRLNNAISAWLDAAKEKSLIKDSSKVAVVIESVNETYGDSVSDAKTKITDYVKDAVSMSSLEIGYTVELADGLK